MNNVENNNQNQPVVENPLTVELKIGVNFISINHYVKV